MKMSTLALFAVASLVALCGVVLAFPTAEPPRGKARADALMGQGNFKDAHDVYQALVAAPASDPAEVEDALSRGIQCLNQLGRVDEIDGFLEAAVTGRKDDARTAVAVAECYLNQIPHQGFVVAGEFARGGRRGGGGRYVDATDRDRVRALQLLTHAIDAMKGDPDRARAGRFFQTLAGALTFERLGGEAWRLQSLTDLDALPDYDEYTRGRWGGWGGDSTGAPVTADGAPVYYHVPESFQKAQNDGERWRWALAQAAEADAGLLNDVRMTLGQFMLGQFGTQTLQQGGFQPMVADDDGDGDEAEPATSIYGLETLKDDETVARLASGVKRFALPDEFNPIKIFQSVVDDPKTGRAEQATVALASLFEDRRQFVRAADYWKQAVEKYGDPNKAYQSRLDQIEKPWGRFEPTSTHPADRGASVDFTFRNGRKVRFEAHEVLVDKLLKDVKDYLRSRPDQLDWQRTDVNDVGARLVSLDQKQYQGDSVATWALDLDPPADHFDRRVVVTTPLQKAGAYLLTATMEGGNVSRVVVWVDDTVLVRKPLEKQHLYFAADARSGAAVEGASLELFGWRTRQIGQGNKFTVDVTEQAATTDADGLAVVDAPRREPRVGVHQWLATARTTDGRLAYLGFTGLWPLDRNPQRFDQTTAIVITDRPVYRPGHSAKFKAWVARARYDAPDASPFAGAQVQVVINNPKGEKILEKTLKADAYGGVDGEVELPTDATLGVYRVGVAVVDGIAVFNRGGGSFRVEEYKKPEFEVKVDAPDEPVALGEKVKATVKADYYFGGPVTQATVKYKVLRREADDRWFPVGRWDWLYGNGYWWFATDASWYPGWNAWGMRAPIAWWWPRPQGPPEVVADAEVPIGPDGKVEIEIDTAFAKAAHPNRDHRYEIQATVTDQSRRAIDGSGAVLVARKPFAVYTWVDRGHYKAGDTITADVRAQTLDRKPVVGKGTLKLLQITYDDQGKPIETPVETWPLALDADGRAEQPIKAAQAGQYRISAVVDDGQGHEIEGGYLVTVAGQGFDGASFHFGDLELVPDRKEYRPGDKMRLQINTERADSTVLLFLRPSNGVYSNFKPIRLKGKSTTIDVPVATADMPNLFVEALTVSNGKLHVQARDVAVPPESRIVDVKVEASRATYKPGEKAKLSLKLTGPGGKPFVGSTALAVYDKAVEYISGGSNVADIKDVFWKWKRSHHPSTESSLSRAFHNLLKPDETPMADLGAFGGGMAPGRDGSMYFKRKSAMRGGMGGMGGGIVMDGNAMMEAAPATPMALAAAPAEKMRRVVAADAFEPDDKAAEAAAPSVRTNFADTAFWAAAIETGPDGAAEVEFPVPDSLTTWKVRSWTMGPGARVGQAEAEFVTSKDLLVRLQAPRFFVQKDEVVLSAVVHSKLKEAKSVLVALELEGSVLEPMDETSRTIDLAAGGEARVDWRVKVAHEGQAVVRMKAVADSDSDAAQMTFPAYVHGMLKMEAIAGAIRPDQSEATVKINVPAERRPEQTRLEVRYSPTLAGALVDALPYLVDYPYGCTEQTLNRFLPTVVTQRILIDMGVDLKAVQAAHTNLNAQQLGPNRPAFPKEHPAARNPVFDIDEVAKMARAGLDRLAEMQLSDGGWGWFSGYGERSYPHTTAQVVHGLQIARKNDLAIPDGMQERGVAWLTSYQAEQVRLLKNGETETKPYRKKADDMDALVFMVLADADVRVPGMLEYLERDRPGLSAQGKCLYGLGLHKFGEAAKLAEVMKNLSQYVVEDEENQTAWLKLPNQGYWWYWYGSETETDAFYLKLLSAVDPRGRLASRLSKYILNNRAHGSYWNSTRDTGYNVEALADFLKASGEDKPDMTVTIAVDGEVRKEVTITPANLFGFDASLVLEGDDLSSGEHSITLARKGTGPLYFNTYLTNFTLEDPIARAGLEVKVDRRVYRLIRDDKAVDVAGGRGQSLAQRVEKYRREPLADGATLKSGDLVEVELKIDSKNDYEYLVFEDYKAAGFEPVEVRSGYNGNDMGAYVEYRDERVAFFVPWLARGEHSVAYRLRAEIPGRFHALPARGAAMYAPELKANSDEVRLEVTD